MDSIPLWVIHLRWIWFWWSLWVPSNSGYKDIFSYQTALYPQTAFLFSYSYREHASAIPSFIPWNKGDSFVEHRHKAEAALTHGMGWAAPVGPVPEAASHLISQGRAQDPSLPLRLPRGLAHSCSFLMREEAGMWAQLSVHGTLHQSKGCKLQ